MALIQLDVSSSEPVDARIARATALVEQAARHAQVVVLPELWHVGAFDLEAARAHALDLDAPVLADLARIAAAHGCWLHAGSFAERSADGRLWNTSVVLDADGGRSAVYRKVHLFGFDSGEAAALTGGDETVVVDSPLGVTGLATCYDLRFPELFRLLTEQGADSFVMPSGWPSRRIEHWDVLLRARAIENQAWVLGCNEIGLQGPAGAQVELGGHSQVVSPSGEVVARAGTDETTLVTDLDVSAAAALRAAFPVLRDIRIRGAFTE